MHKKSQCIKFIYFFRKLKSVKLFYNFTLLGNFPLFSILKNDRVPYQNENLCLKYSIIGENSKTRLQEETEHGRVPEIPQNGHNRFRSQPVGTPKSEDLN